MSVGAPVTGMGSVLLMTCGKAAVGATKLLGEVKVVQL